MMAGCTRWLVLSQPSAVPTHRSEQMSSVRGLGSMSMRRCTRYTVVALPGRKEHGQHRFTCAGTILDAERHKACRPPSHGHLMHALPLPATSALPCNHALLGNSPLRCLLVHGCPWVNKVGHIRNVHLRTGTWRQQGAAMGSRAATACSSSRWRCKCSVIGKPCAVLQSRSAVLPPREAHRLNPAQSLID